MVFLSSFTSFLSLLERRKTEGLSNLSQFARKSRRFRAALRKLSPGSDIARAGDIIIEKVNRFAADQDYALLVSLLDALRPFLNHDDSREGELFWSALIDDCRTTADARL